MAKKKTAKKSTALARREVHGLEPVQPGVMGVFERMARDPKLTVDKLQRLIELQKDIRAVDAKTAFDEAYQDMVLEIPSITRRGKVKNKQGQVQSHYAKFEDIMRVVKPIIKRFGFTLHFRTEWPDSKTLEVVGILTHRGGHSRESRFRSPADDTGGKNAVQGLGSARSYGNRYTVIDLLCIICEGVDDDGQTAHNPVRRESQERRPEDRTVAYDFGPEGSATVKPASQGQSVAPKREGEVISDPQRKRLFAMMKAAGRTEDELKTFLQTIYQISSTRDILKRDYDQIVKAVEASGDLRDK